MRTRLGRRRGPILLRLSPTSTSPIRSGSDDTNFDFDFDFDFASTNTLTYSEAVNDAIRLAMRKDPTVILLGEDVAGGAGVDHLQDDQALGGALGVTKGLVQEFGRSRARYADYGVGL